VIYTALDRRAQGSAATRCCRSGVQIYPTSTKSKHKGDAVCRGYNVVVLGFGPRILFSEQLVNYLQFSRPSALTERDGMVYSATVIGLILLVIIIMMMIITRRRS